MIPYRNSEIIASFLFFYAIKIFCSFVVWRREMYRKQPTLTSIPERNEEVEDENLSIKWVPKKKHEVLKAKYKCLKKLFQIYDASVIGILPESYANEGAYLEEDVPSKKRRKKRSHRTKTDACAGTEISQTTPEISQQSAGDETEKDSIATAVLRELKSTNESFTSTQMEPIKETKYVATDSRANIRSESRVNVQEPVDQEYECNPCTQCNNLTQIATHPVPYLILNEKRRLTRFQCFVQRIFGIRPERPFKNYVPNSEHVYSASDNNITHTHNYSYNYADKRRRRGLRFRRLKRPKKIQSETALRDMKSPVILTYVQSVQRNCLMDTTRRQCPIPGCGMVLYGIINYNDHLNLCHFKDRKFICHYCHEGFETEYQKIIHENEHIGITKLGVNLSTPNSLRQFTQSNIAQTNQPVSQCDVPDDKLKKIVSFFEKISDPDHIVSEIKKNRFSDENFKNDCGKTDDSSSEKRTVSCVNLNRKVQKPRYSSESDSSGKHPYVPFSCHMCGEYFEYRRQLSLHVDLEHRMHNKFSKFHSCASILDDRNSNIDPRQTMLTRQSSIYDKNAIGAKYSKHFDMVSEDGKLQVQSVDRSSVRRVNTSLSSISRDSCSDVSRRKSEQSICDNVVYCSSMETVKKPSVVNNFVQRMRSGLNSYKWEPGTKIIRV